MEPLDNPVWHALTGPHERFAEAVGRARRYDPAVAAFAALPDEPAGEDWRDLRALIEPGGIAVLVRPQLRVPDDWETVFHAQGQQMVAATALEPPSESFVTLGDGDVPDMLTLVDRTRPGPFLPRTVELGGYLGARDSDGTLIAMAGARMRIEGMAEISAVCTDAGHRGRGLASALVRAVGASIQARGDWPFLHVVPDNVGAIRVYERLGFKTRTVLDVFVVRASRDASSI